ncbi:MAG: DNA-binding protein [Caldisericia bacterium]|nr:DNA-binding protein [Caldisericia bacterium]
MDNENKDLTSSKIDRNNILNNRLVVKRVIEKIGIKGAVFEGGYKFTIDQVAEMFVVSKSTIEKILNTNNEEISENGYEVLEGYRLRTFVSKVYSSDTVKSYGIKHRRLGIFNIRSLLNIAMLLRDSDIARTIRSYLLDTAIKVLNEKTLGNKNLINLRDRDFIGGYITEQDYRKKLTDAIDHHVEDKPFKYANITSLIYKSIFKSNAREYRKILSLGKKASVRLTLYTEILDLVSSYENGIAATIIKKAESLDRELTYEEVKHIINDIENDPLMEPTIHKARIKMSSRDYNFRDAIHERIEEYIQAVPEEDYEKFLGEQSVEIDKQLEELKDILLRLK